jgi:alcohol dehydrogenase
VPGGAQARALVLEAPHRLVARSVDLPAVDDGGGILRVEACGLCGTDHEQFTGALFPGFAFVPGHEVVGTLEAAGAAALERWGVSVGDRVAVEVFQSCRSCERCRRGEYRRCVRHGLADMIGFIPVDRAPGLWGGYATSLVLPADAMLLPVPDGMDPVLATLFNPLGAGIRWGRTVPGTGTGDVVAVLGPGIRGLSALVAAREAGAGFVLVTGRGERDRDRLETARRFGADAVVDVGTDDPVAVLRREAGSLADVVVDVTAKAPAALGQAVALARPGGTVVLAGTRGSDETPGFSPDAVVAKELHLVGALGVDAPAYAEALGLLSSGRHPFAEVSRRVVGLDGVADLLTDMSGEGAPPPLHGVVVPGGDR